jgi:type IV pilus assembly protein PilP
MKPFVVMASMGLVMALAGCSDAGKDELRQWMASERARVRPNVKPIEEPKRFTPQAYTEASAMEPFNSQKLTQALRRESAQPNNSALIGPELARRKEPLEAFPLDAMAMVGSLDRDGKPVALVRVDKLLYQVRVGNHLGLNYGLVTRISETELALREIVQDAAGEWIERVATLQLQEGSKK